MNVGQQVVYKNDIYKIIGKKGTFFTKYLLKKDNSTDRVSIPARYATTRKRKMWEQV